MPERLSKQLAAAVTSIRWSYAIFWSISSRNPGMLEWGDGYYNGEIKTRKTVQAKEIDESEIGMQRSEQLRELYISLSMGETAEPCRRLASLSPEDLTPSEWYYLVCMTFVFTPGQGLPGQVLATGQFIWVDNAHSAESKSFGRSLLAKSASIQTVVAFPFLEGVLELGVAEQIPEDLNLVERIKATFLKMTYPIVSNEPCQPGNNDTSVDIMDDFNILENNHLEEVHMDSTYDDLPDGMDADALQVQSWYFGSDEYSNGNFNSSSDCVSQTFVNVVDVNNLSLLESHKCKQVDLQCENQQYKIILETLSKSSRQLLLGSYSRKFKSCFVNWNSGLSICMKRSNGTSQNILKKVLFDVTRMRGSVPLGSCDATNDELWKPEADESGINHILSERRRRERLNERFKILKSLIPVTKRADKVSLLDDTIEYLKKMKKGVDDLEWQLDYVQKGAVPEPQDTVEKSSNNCDSNNMNIGHNMILQKDDDMTLSLEKDGLIQLRCPWREDLLLNIITVLSHLCLAYQSVESSNVDGILSLTLKYKVKGSGAVSTETLREVLERTIRS